MNDGTKIIVITGKQGSGKSTLAAAIEREVMRSKDRTTSAVVIKFAEPLYTLQKVIYDHITAYYDLKGLEPGEKDRPLLQWLGTEWGQGRYGATVWADVWKSRVSALVVGVAITDDLRFPHELATAASVGAIKIRLTADEETRASRIGKNFSGTSHPSETALDGVSDAAFDFVFSSDKMSVEEIMTELRTKGVFDV